MSDNPSAIQKEVHAVFCGTIDQNAVQRLLNGIAVATQNSVKTVHLLFQSTGGAPGDGICLYNFFKALPIKLVIYNAGSVSSAAVLAYLGAHERKTSAHANFMIHRTFISPQMATSERLQSMTKGLIMDDDRSEAILKANIRLGKDKWVIHQNSDLWLSAQDAIDCGLATSFGEFSPPLGVPLYSV